MKFFAYLIPYVLTYRMRPFQYGGGLKLATGGAIGVGGSVAVGGANTAAGGGDCYWSPWTAWSQCAKRGRPLPCTEGL